MVRLDAGHEVHAEPREDGIRSPAGRRPGRVDARVKVDAVYIRPNHDDEGEDAHMAPRTSRALGRLRCHRVGEFLG